MDVTIKGTRHHITSDMVRTAMRDQTPGRIQTYVVGIDGVEFPPKQVLAQTLRIPVADFITTRAQSILGQLGFPVRHVRMDDPEHGTEPDLRVQALGLAVMLLARRGDAAADDVLATADRFVRWLEAERA